MKITIILLAVISFLNAWSCAASGITVIESTDCSIQYMVDNENSINFTPEVQPNYKENANNVGDEELNKLIEEAVIKQKKHPFFDPKYAINPKILQNRILLDLEKYYKFPDQHIQHQRKVLQKDLDVMIKEAKLKEFSESRNIEIDNLKNIVSEKLNIDYLLDNLDQEFLTVTCTAIIERELFIEKKLLFQNQHVGSFEVIMLLSKQISALHPIIIGLHGHGQSAEKFQKEFFVEDLVEEGFSFIIPSFRAMGLTETEYIISKRLLLNGFTLMGLRVYETLLVEKYLNTLNYIDQNKICLMGHSGGSSVASFISVLSPLIKVKVVDCESSFIDITDLYGIYDEIIPDLVDYAQTIHNYGVTSGTKKLKVSYGYINSKQKVVEFFKKHLK